MNSEVFIVFEGTTMIAIATSYWNFHFHYNFIFTESFRENSCMIFVKYVMNKM